MQRKRGAEKMLSDWRQECKNIWKRERTKWSSVRNSERKRLRILPETFISQGSSFFSLILNACFIIESCALEILIRAAAKETVAKRLFWPSDHVKRCKTISHLFTSTLVYFICPTFSISLCKTSQTSSFIFLCSPRLQQTASLTWVSPLNHCLQQFSTGFVTVSWTSRSSTKIPAFTINTKKYRKCYWLQ